VSRRNRSNQIQKGTCLIRKACHALRVGMRVTGLQRGLDLRAQGPMSLADLQHFRVIRHRVLHRSAAVGLDHPDTPRHSFANRQTKGFFPLRGKQQHINLRIKAVHLGLRKARVDLPVPLHF
jgi:hypothetical protein